MIPKVMIMALIVAFFCQIKYKRIDVFITLAIFNAILAIKNFLAAKKMFNSEFCQINIGIETKVQKNDDIGTCNFSIALSTGCIKINSKTMAIVDNIVWKTKFAFMNL